MKFKKSFLVIMLCLAMVLATVLSSCGSAPATSSSASTTASSTSAPASTSPASTAASTAAAITPEAGAQITHFTLNTADDDYLPTIVTDFEQANPGIKINLVRVPWADFDSKFQTMIAGGTAPDVSSGYASQSFAGYQSKDLLLDLTPFIQADNFKPSDYGIDQNLYNGFNVDGKQYGIPFRSYVSVLAYNKDLFDKAGIPYPTSDYEDKSWTWDKLIEIAKKLTIISKNPAGSQYGLSFYWDSPLNFIPMFGAKAFDDATWTNGGYPHECYFNSQDTVNALQKLIDMAYKDKVLIPPATAQSLAGNLGNPFLAGKVAMSIDGAWSIGGAKSLPFKMGLAAIPWYNDVTGRSTNYTDPLFILKSSKCPNASYLWIKYQMQNDVQIKVTKLSGNAPINSAAMDTYYNFFPNVDANDMKNVVSGGVKYGINAYGNVVVYSGQIDTILRNEWNPALSGKAQAKDVAPVIQQKISDLIKKLNSDNGK